jgi:hypothetical protein
MLWFYKSFFPVVWIAFLLYWQIKAINTKTTQRRHEMCARVTNDFQKTARSCT